MLWLTYQLKEIKQNKTIQLKDLKPKQNKNIQERAL